MKTAIAFIFPLISILLLSSCATQNLLVQKSQGGSEQKKMDSIFKYNSLYEYTLRKDDKINISVWDHEDLSVGSIYGIYNSNEVYGKWLMLDAAGNVTIPKIGNVNLLGLTLIKAKEKLMAEYKKWIVNPVVEIKILNKEITVLGELKTPGKYLLEKENNTLLEIIGVAGDFDFYANKKNVQIIRTVNNQVVAYTVDLTKMENFSTANVQLHPGDIVYVPSRKGKHWDKRAGSTIVPVASAISSLVLLGGIIK